MSLRCCLDAAASQTSPPIYCMSRPHKKSVYKAWRIEKPHQWAGGLNRSVLICIWSWRAGLEKRWSTERHAESDFSFARAPWVRITEAAFVWLWTRKRERERGQREGEEEESVRLLVWSEWAGQAEWAPSLSLRRAITHEQDNFSLDLSLPSLKMTSR